MNRTPPGSLSVTAAELSRADAMLVAALRPEVPNPWPAAPMELTPTTLRARRWPRYVALAASIALLALGLAFVCTFAGREEPGNRLPGDAGPATARNPGGGAPRTPR
jgi:hypothetical protein